MSHKDEVFMKMFLAILGVLIAFAFIFYFIAQSVSVNTQDSSMSEASILKRIEPAGKVSIKEEPTQVAVTTVTKTGGSASAIPAACVACHTTGVLGAPKIGSKADWQPRLAQGMDALIASSSKGKGSMPPQGAQFNNDALKNIINTMLEKSGL